jgi:hypothetical protein
VDVRHLVRQQLEAAAQVPLLPMQTLSRCQTLAIAIFQVLDEMLGFVE